jgi:hypothetical protein
MISNETPLLGNNCHYHGESWVIKLKVQARLCHGHSIQLQQLQTSRFADIDHTKPDSIGLI